MVSAELFLWGMENESGPSAFQAGLLFANHVQKSSKVHTLTNGPRNGHGELACNSKVALGPSARQDSL